jgi:phage-related protein
MLTVGVLLKSLTGVWAFTMLTVGVLLISLTGIWPFILFTVGFLLKSLTGVWHFIMVILVGSAQDTDGYLGLYYAYC